MHNNLSVQTMSKIPIIMAVPRVVSSEISGGKFPEIYSKLPGNLSISCFQVQYLCFNFMHYVQKNNLF